MATTNSYWIVARWRNDLLGSAGRDGVFYDSRFKRERDAHAVAYALNRVHPSRPWRVQEVTCDD